MNGIDHLTIQEALPAFYSRYNLPPGGGADDVYVRIELLKGISVYIPNTAGRKKVVLKHDIHHLITGYSGLLKGESEISSWELSSGCFHRPTAFLLNLYGMHIGMVFNLRSIWKAWLRGKRTRNLYPDKYREAVLLNKTIGELKGELGLQKEPAQNKQGLWAFLSFLVFLVLSSVVSALSIVLIPFAFLYTFYIIFGDYVRSGKH